MSNPTLHAASNVNAEDDAKALQKAMKGLGTNEKAIIDVLCHRSAAQRQEIVTWFKALYSKELEKELKKELSGNFERVIIALITTPVNYLAQELHDAVSGMGTNEGRLIEILCPSTNYEIQEIRDAYFVLYNKHLENDIKGDASGPFKSLLVSVLQGERDESDDVDAAAVKEDVNALYKGGEGKAGTDASVFVSIFSKRSYAHLRQVMSEYQNIRGISLKKGVKAEFRGDAALAFKAILSCAQNKTAYYAKCLNNAMVGMGTRDRELIRLIVSRCEKDLGTIKADFEFLYKKPLASVVSGETSGIRNADYKKSLLALIG